MGIEKIVLQLVGMKNNTFIYPMQPVSVDYTVTKEGIVVDIFSLINIEIRNVPQYGYHSCDSTVLMITVYPPRTSEVSAVSSIQSTAFV